MMRVLVFWEPVGLALERTNPYAGLLARAMASLGVETIAAERNNLTAAWLRENRDRFQVLHVHWPWALYSADTPERSLELCADVLDMFLLARSLGWKVVWTMHNLYPHESTTHHLDHIARLTITSCATAVIVHCEHARGLLSQVFHRDRGVFVIPHGHFVDAYPNDLSIADARRRMGFGERNFVYLFFGYIRPNKGVEQLLDSFASLSGPDLRLLFAVRICTEYGASVAARAKQGDTRIVVHESSFYTNEEFQLFFNAADVAVFPFTDILTSGSVITALSFRCPVIVPSIGCLPEIVDETVGEVYDPRVPGALQAAIASAAQRARVGYRAAIDARLHQLSWEAIARQTLEAYRF
jgi:glycosyltransferase involved in cell wall biosynthesis